MPPFSSGFSGLPDALPGDNFAIGDIVDLITRLSGQEFGKLQPLQDQSISTLQGILSGNTDLTGRLAAPGIAGIKAQTPGTLRQLSDTLPSGGLLQQAQANAITGETDQVANLLGQTNNNLVGPALNQLFSNQNLLSTFTGPLAAVGGLRASEKAAGRGKK